MTRSIPPSMSGVLEELELEQATLVTSARLEELLERFGVRTPTRVVAARLRDRGWLLPTGRSGVWEFAPAAVAGAYSRHDPVTQLRAFLGANPGERCALTFQAAVWAHGLADRPPARPEVAAATAELVRRLPDGLAGWVFAPHLEPATLRGVPVLAPESVLTHMSARPRAVRSWSSALEWLPDLAAALEERALTIELRGRAASVLARAGYLLQRLRPDLADAVRALGPLHGKTWFGPRGTALRRDGAWDVADTLLPFDPRTLAPAG